MIRQMWALREQIQGEARQVSNPDNLPPIAAMWRGWRRVVALQKLQRELRRQGRDRKIQQIEQAVNSENVFKAARRFAPKTKKQRLQLRTPDGHLQTKAEEFEDIVQYFSNLYASHTPPGQEQLQDPLNLSWDEVDQAIGKLSPSKAMPTYSPPAALWKAMRLQLAPVLVQQFNTVFRPGVINLPRAWCLSELVLLPKPGKTLTSPSQLRPICLLPPVAKVLATTLAMRLEPYLARYLHEIPLHDRSVPPTSIGESTLPLRGGPFACACPCQHPVLQKAGSH